MEENRNDIEILKAMIKENFEEQRKLIAKLETALEAVTSFNGKQMLDSRDMRLMLKVCDRTLIRWRNSGKLPFFKLSGKIYFWASDVYKFLREECLNEDFIDGHPFLCREADISFLSLYLHFLGSHVQDFTDFLQGQGQAYFLNCVDVGQDVQHLKTFAV